MKKYYIHILSTLFILFSLNVSSQNVTEKGVASIVLDRATCRDGKPADRNKQIEAVEKAKKSAWEKYTSNLSSDKSSAYYALEEKYLSELDKYITDYVILTANCSKTDRNYTISIRATINDTKFTNALTAKSKSSVAQKNLQGQAVVVLVVPRKTIEATIFDARVTKQSMSKKGLSADEIVSSDEGSVSVTEISSETQSLTVGGSTKQQATKRIYDIGDLNAAYAQITNVLVPLGMRTFDIARLESQAVRAGYDPFLKEVLDQFSGKIGDYGANISPQKRNEIVDLIIDLGKGRLNYFILGTVDSSVARQDPDTGSHISDVLVNIQLFAINDFFGAESIAAVGPEMKSAFGLTDAAAENAALKKAFNEATSSLILKL